MFLLDVLSTTSILDRQLTYRNVTIGKRMILPGAVAHALARRAVLRFDRISTFTEVWRRSSARTVAPPADTELRRCHVFLTTLPR